MRKNNPKQVPHLSLHAIVFGDPKRVVWYFWQILLLLLQKNSCCSEVNQAIVVHTSQALEGLCDIYFVRSLLTGFRLISTTHTLYSTKQLKSVSFDKQLCCICPAISNQPVLLFVEYVLFVSVFMALTHCNLFIHRLRIDQAALLHTDLYGALHASPLNNRAIYFNHLEE